MNTLKLAEWLERSGWTVRLLANEQSPMYANAVSALGHVTSVQQLSGKPKPSAGTIVKWLGDAKDNAILFTPFNKDIKPLSAFKRWHARKMKLVYQQHMKVGVKKKDIFHRLRYAMLDLWISPLPYLKEETIRLTPVPAEKIKVIALGLDPSKFTPGGHGKNKSRELLSLPQDVRMLGVVGRIDPKKGQDFSIRCIARLKEHHSRDYHLLIMGNTTHLEGNEHFNKLKRLITELHLEDRVHLRPYTGDVTLFYEAVDICCVPSHGETYGMVTLEAMLMKKPVVGVNTDGTRALLQEGRLGWLHELEDLDGCCRQILAVEQEAATSGKLSAAREEVLHNYSENELMKATEQALQDLLQGS